MAKENEALYDFRLGIENFKGYQEICYTLKKNTIFTVYRVATVREKQKKKNLHGRVKVRKFCEHSGENLSSCQ